MIKPILIIVFGILLLFIILVLFAIYRFATLKVSLPARTPLAQAVFDGDTENVRILLREGADANSTMNVSYQISQGGNISSSFTVPQAGAEQPATDMSVLAFAAMQGSKDIMSLLLDKGANANSQDKHGQTPLIVAAWEGSADCVKLLLKNRADLNSRDRLGRTALWWAQAEAQKDAVEVLRKAGAKE